MSDRWIPFLRRKVSHITPREHLLEMPKGTTPWGLWILYAVGLTAAFVMVRLFAPW
jgi:hypothetical protein